LSASLILFLFIAVTLAAFAASMALDALNIAHVRRHADAVPERFRPFIDKAGYQRSVRYTLARARLGMVEEVWDTAILVVFVLGGCFGLIDRLAWPSAESHLVRGVVYFAVMGLLFLALSIPFRLYSQFVIEERFGFNRMTWRLWLADLLKSIVIGALIGGPLLVGLLWFMAAAGGSWWLWAAGFVITLMVFLQILYPAFIAPWFNRFTPLPEGELKERIVELARRTGYRLSGVFQMDASRRSSHSNAYFAGLGSSRRIVLFDTLVRSMSPPQIEAVLAHEIGHWRRRHVLKKLCWAGALQLAGFYALSRLMVLPEFHAAFGFEAPAPYRALAVFMLGSEPFLFFLTPFFSALSRRYEYEADRFAVEAAQGTAPLRGALIALFRENLSNLTPHPWYGFFHHSHPTLPERLARLEAP
jgi:STE24 endopeptidase